MKQRDPLGHKGAFGTVLVIGGSDSEFIMIGGPVLSARAVLRSGSGKAIMAMPEGIVRSAVSILPESVGFSLPKNPNDEEFARLLQSIDSIIIGPGFGVGQWQTSILTVVLETKKPTVVDADALNALAKLPELAKQLHQGCVLTPHVGELERICSALNISSAQKLAAHTGTTVVSKSHRTLVTDGKKDWELDKPNSALATGGSGDVLAGIIGGLLAQDLVTSVFESAKNAVMLHSKAGARLKPGSLATEIADAIDITNK